MKNKKRINAAEYANEVFMDAIYELVQNEAIRLHQFRGLEIVLAGKVAAYIAILPIVAIAAGGQEGVADKLIKLIDELFKNINEI